MENRDEQLWQIAKKRVGFKKQLASYIIVNGFLWSLWYFTERHYETDIAPWPIWCTLGWGIGLAFSYFKAYHNNREDDVMKEYQKLKEQEEK